MFDLVIKHGLVVDGTGKDPYYGSVYIKSGRIVAIEESMSNKEAMEVIDAKGKIITPGFIDMHSHSELDLLINPLAESVVRQGITTVLSFIACGRSTGPLLGNAIIGIQEHIRNRFGEKSPIDVNWNTSGEFYDRLERDRVAVNYVNLVGATTLRECIIGFERRPPTQAELQKMESLAQGAMEEGAWGVSTGLEYAPGAYANKAEIIALCKVASHFGGIYVTHMRSYAGEYIGAIEEAIDIGRQAKIPVQIAHNRPSGKQNWGKSESVLKMIEDARNEEIDITSDNFPYIAGLTRMKEFIPSWAHEGGTEPFISRLQDPSTRRKLIEEIKRGEGYSTDLIKEEGWDTIQIISHFLPQYTGKSILSIAKEKSVDPYELALDILIADKGRTWVNVFEACWDDIDRMVSHPTTLVGTDAWALAPYGVLGKGIPHPRMYGTFPQMIKRYVKDQKTLSISELAQKMSFLPAKKIGLKDRGCIREGAWADLVIFDLETIRETCTYADSHHFPKGIEYVLVNGSVVVKGENHTKSLPGMVLRRGHA